MNGNLRQIAIRTACLFASLPVLRPALRPARRYLRFAILHKEAMVGVVGHITVADTDTADITAVTGRCAFRLVCPLASRPALHLVSPMYQLFATRRRVAGPLMVAAVAVHIWAAVATTVVIVLPDKRNSALITEGASTHNCAGSFLRRSNNRKKSNNTTVDSKVLVSLKYHIEGKTWMKSMNVLAAFDR